MKFSRYPQLDLDWLARDLSGFLAIFTTAGHGFAPSGLDSHEDPHSAAMEHIPTPNWGSQAVWSDYAKAGLYCYDWQESTGTYVQMAGPVASPSPELIAQFGDHQIPYEFPFKFSEVQEIAEGDWSAT